MRSPISSSVRTSFPRSELVSTSTTFDVHKFTDHVRGAFEIHHAVVFGTA